MQKDAHQHLIPIANKALAFTLKAAWKVTKGMVLVAFRIPRIFADLNAPTYKKPAESTLADRQTSTYKVYDPSIY
jgi:hypothetical protein